MSQLDRLHALDDALIVFSKHLNLTKHLTPLNVAEQREIFVAKDGHYDPQFVYHFPSQEQLQTIISQLQALHEEYFSAGAYTEGMAKLLEEKIYENILKAELLIAYGKQDRDRIDHLGQLLWGDWNEEILDTSRRLQESYRDPPAQLWGDHLNADQIQTLLSSYKAEHGLDDLTIVREEIPSKFMIRFGSTGARLMFHPQARLRQHTLEADIRHELGVHYMRYHAGRQSGWHILTYGTAQYLATEEGLALYAFVQYKKQFFPAFEKLGIYQKYIFLHDMVAKSAQDMSGYLRAHGITQDPRVMFDLILRSKLGVQDCSIRCYGNTFPQMKVYADGYHKVLAWLDAGNDRHLLMQGKIKIEDLASLG